MGYEKTKQDAACILDAKHKFNRNKPLKNSTITKLNSKGVSNAHARYSSKSRVQNPCS